MKNENEKKSNEGKESINKSRRKLSKTSLVAPVLLSLASKPSWAFVCTFSGAMSGNLSVEKAGFVCDKDNKSTKPPSFYITNTSWPNYNTTTKFNTVFSTGPAIKLAALTTVIPPEPEVTDPSLLQVLNNPNRVVFVSSGLSDNRCAVQYVTAILNAYNTPLLLFPFTPQQIIAGWQSQDANLCTQLKAIQIEPGLNVEQVDTIIHY